MVKKKKTREEEETTDVEDYPEDIIEDEELDEPEDVEAEEIQVEQIARPKALSRKPTNKAELEREMKRIKSQIDSISIQEESLDFMKLAPGKIHDLETAVTENRSYIISLTNKFKELEHSFHTLLTTK